MLLQLVRDERVARLRGSLLGRWWAFVLPLLESGAFTLVFALFIGLRSPTEYLPFVFIGIFLWRAFARSATVAAVSLISGGALLRELPIDTTLPAAAAVLAALHSALVAAPLLLLVTIATAGVPGVMALAWVPLGVLLFVATCFGCGLLLAAASALVRDIGIALGPVLGIALFAAPIVYPATVVPEPYRSVMLVNPIAAAVELVRAGLLGAAPPGGLVIAAACAVAAALLGGGIFVHGRFGYRLREVV